MTLWVCLGVGIGGQGFDYASGCQDEVGSLLVARVLVQVGGFETGFGFIVWLLPTYFLCLVLLSCWQQGKIRFSSKWFVTFFQCSFITFGVLSQ